MGRITLQVKNWKSFQHYKERRPPWIKLHKTTLDDYAFHCLPDASRALAPMLWLLASEYEDGIIDCTVAEIAFRLRLTDQRVIDALKPLVSSGFITCTHDASGVLAECKQEATPETEKRQRREETEAPSFSEFNPVEAAGYCMEAWHIKGNENRQIISEVIAEIKDRSPKDAAEWLVEERSAYEKSRLYQDTEPRYRKGIPTWLKDGTWFNWRGPKAKQADGATRRMTGFEIQDAQHKQWAAELEAERLAAKENGGAGANR